MESKKKRGNGNIFSQRVAEKEVQKLKALKEKKESAWMGLGMFGMVGWSVAVPTLLGVALGIWLDKTYPQSFSWTLTGLILGLIAGCVIAWNWVIKER
jgi:ATP synthase protein I